MNQAHRTPSRIGAGLSNKVKVILVVVVVAIVLFVVSFASHKESIIIGVPNWESGEATAHFLKETIESEFNTPVVLRYGEDNEPLTNEEIYSGIAEGTIHIHPEGWVPLHSNYHTQYADSLMESKYGYSTKQGLCVVAAVAEEYRMQDEEDLRKIEGSDIWVGASGWSSTEQETERAERYGYAETLNVLVMDEEQAFERIEESIDSEEPFVFYCYEPSSMKQRYDIVELTEPEDDQRPREQVYVYYAKSLEDTNASVAEYVRNIQLERTQVNEWLVEDTEEEEETNTEDQEDNEDEA